MVVYRVNMYTGDKEEVDLTKHPYENEKFFKDEINNWNYHAALQAKIKTDSNRNNGPLWLYYWV
jgi:hypothetical protein